MTEEQIISKNKERVKTAKSKKGYGFTYFAKQNFKKNEIVMSGLGKIINHQTAHCSVQIGSKKHYMPKKWTGKYWNHSCEPNTYVRTRTDGFPDLITLRNIKIGDEITYAYWMTEYSWIKNADELKVKCKCDSKQCQGKIFSFSTMPERTKQRIIKKKLCSSYLYAQ